MADSANNHFDLTIVGGGAVGSALALGAMQSDCPHLRVALVESGDFPKTHALADDPARYAASPYQARLNTLNRSSVSLLRQLGAWDEIAAIRSCPFERLCVWDEEGSAELCFDGASSQLGAHHPLGYVVEAGLLMHSLSARLAEWVPADADAHPPGTRAKTHDHARELRLFARCSVLDVEQDAEAVQLRLQDGTVLRSRYAFAADGAASSVRALSGFSWRERDCAQTAIVCVCAHELAHDFVARQRFLSSGPLAFLPLSSIDAADAKGDAHTHLSSVVWSVDDHAATELLALPEDQFCERLARAFEHRLGALSLRSARHGFALRYGAAGDYVRGRVVLAGDAAHTLHPMAGLGVNLGFADVSCLLRALPRYDGMQLPLGAYRATRCWRGNATVYGLEALRQLFSARAPSARWLRNTGLEVVARNSVLRRFFVHWASS